MYGRLLFREVILLYSYRIIRPFIWIYPMIYVIDRHDAIVEKEVIIL